MTTLGWLLRFAAMVALIVVVGVGGLLIGSFLRRLADGLIVLGG